MTSSSIHDRVVERIYVKGIFELTSTYVIGSGEDERTDVDFVRDWRGRPYIPGTSLAGVLRNFVASCDREEDELVRLMFGNRKSDEDNMTQSRLYVSDAYLFGEWNPLHLSVRDGVSLSVGTKTAEEQKKFDFEVVEPQTKFVVRLELVLREKDPVEQLETLLFQMLNAMVGQQIYIGAKKRRGFGRGKLHSLEILKLDFRSESKCEDYIKQWLQFDWDSFKGNIELNDLNRSDVILLERAKPKKTCRIQVPLKIVHSVIIRNYRVSSFENDAHDVDYMHLLSGNCPVIAGTSWAGAFRHRMFEIMEHLFRLKGLGREDSSKHAGMVVDDLFGFVDAKKKTAKASRIWFSESVVCDGALIKQDRIKIDRFTGGVAGSAFFQEIPVYGGTTDLEVVIESMSEDELKEDIGLLILTIKDFMAGYLTIGGETNIGKGIFSGEKIWVLMENEAFELGDERQQQYLQALSRKIHRMAEDAFSAGKEQEVS